MRKVAGNFSSCSNGIALQINPVTAQGSLREKTYRTLDIHAQLQRRPEWETI